MPPLHTPGSDARTCRLGRPTRAQGGECCGLSSSTEIVRKDSISITRCHKYYQIVRSATLEHVLKSYRFRHPNPGNDANREANHSEAIELLGEWSATSIQLLGRYTVSFRMASEHVRWRMLPMIALQSACLPLPHLSVQSAELQDATVRFQNENRKTVRWLP